MKTWLLLSVTLLFACIALAAQGNQQLPVLVLLKDTKSQSKFSKFLNILEKGLGFSLDIKQADEKVTFSKYGEYKYHSLIVLGADSDTDFSEDLSLQTVMDFVKAGHNVLLAGGATSVSSLVRDIADECDVHFIADGRVSVNPLSKLSAHAQSFAASNFAPVAPVLGSKKINPVAFRGTAMQLGANQLLFPILSGDATTITTSVDGDDDASDDEEGGFTAGSKAVLVSALQPKGSAGRVLFSASAELFTDKYFQQTIAVNGQNVAAGNEDFSRQVASWTLKKHGVLRYSAINHYKLDDSNQVIEKNPAVYKITDNLRFNVVIEELKDGQWVGYQASDVQLEFIMLDPYVRTLMTPSATGLYNVEFKVPDVYGVFKFKVNHMRKGYNYLVFEQQIAVRPYRLNEFERFIYAAYPYYTSTFSMVVAFFLLTLFFLYSK